MKKMALKVLALLVALLMGACGEDLLIDTESGTAVKNSVEQKAVADTEQVETAGNTLEQEEPLSGEEAVIDKATLDQESLVEEPVTDAELFDWDVYKAEKAAWEALALGKTGYTFTQTHRSSQTEFYRYTSSIVVDDIPYELAGSGQSDWEPPFFRKTISSLVINLGGIGALVEDKAWREKHNILTTWTSLWVKYDRQFHYPTYLQIKTSDGDDYTAHIRIETLGPFDFDPPENNRKYPFDFGPPDNRTSPPPKQEYPPPEVIDNRKTPGQEGTDRVEFCF
jgi:hypothetical protein